MVCAPVRLIIPSLKLGDYLSVQAHNPCSISHLDLAWLTLEMNMSSVLWVRNRGSYTSGHIILNMKRAFGEFHKCHMK